MKNNGIVNIGFGNIAFSGRILAILSPDSAPIKRAVQEAKERNKLIDATYGRKTRSVIFLDNDSIILSSVQPETIAGRAHKDGAEAVRIVTEDK